MLSKALKKLNLVKTETKKVKSRPALATDTNSTFVYQTGADVQKTWRKYGWVPPSEHRNDYEFAKNRNDR